MQLEDIVIEMLGPRWHRQASLADMPVDAARAPYGAGDAGDANPATSSPYDGRARGAPRNCSAACPGPATPPPENLPPGPMMPDAVAVPAGPPTPTPAPASPTTRPRAPAPQQPAAAPPLRPGLPRAAPPGAPARPTAPGISHAGQPSGHRLRTMLLSMMSALVIGVIVAAIIASRHETSPAASKAPLEPVSRAPAANAATSSVDLTAGPLSIRVAPGWRRVPAANTLPRDSRSIP